MRHLLATGVLIATCGAASAQGWPPWADDAFGRRFNPRQPSAPESRDFYWRPPERFQQDRFAPDPGWSRSPTARKPPQVAGGGTREGGDRPEIKPLAPSIVAFEHAYPASSIVIDVGARRLYYVLEGKQAYEYAISVGRDGFDWTGTEKISRKQAWPDWHPPAEMRERDPSLPEKMTGGLKNPLGAMALYLGDTLYRIHGTNDANSIGRAASSGCFRMLNANVLHLASLVEVGTEVSVVASLAPQAIATSRAPVQATAAPRPPARARTETRDWPPYDAWPDRRWRDRESWRPPEPRWTRRWPYADDRWYWR